MGFRVLDLGLRVYRVEGLGVIGFRVYVKIQVF